VRRFVVNLADRSTFTRTSPGACQAVPTPTIGEAAAAAERRCWVLVRVPFRAPADSTDGFNVRRVRALRLTMVSGPEESDTAFTTLALARRAAGRARRGCAGPTAPRRGSPATRSSAVGRAGWSRASVGTQDSTRDYRYQSPPGVTDETDERPHGARADAVQVNERALRLQAGRAGGLARALRARRRRTSASPRAPRT
jgi:cell surface protein SprA